MHSEISSTGSVSGLFLARSVETEVRHLRAISVTRWPAAEGLEEVLVDPCGLDWSPPLRDWVRFRRLRRGREGRLAT